MWLEGESKEENGMRWCIIVEPYRLQDFRVYSKSNENSLEFFKAELGDIVCVCAWF
jgi:hypothetical protein